jgi:hypothetical protein
MTLSRLLKVPPAQIDHIDIAVLNLACADGLSGTEVCPVGTGFVLIGTIPFAIIGAFQPHP